ncbi:NAD(P)-binding domain-containing protein [Streptomyces syringium]|uniref:3-hydroxyisobutyrate dehydrogenase-like beta-hydroxyacid dehydrogenase n=1 Tax=Streptomyces syringium TaxID=76729 RepID=A0ABS4XXC2_9ACTN|nr:3-hydroxyisobutyrate dehydrogenase-like beta-hydroxyacid dehydrogenase [Streptomyces syringium]
MGLALAATLLEQGHPTTVWNRTPEKADGLVVQGARRAATIADAVAASPVTVRTSVERNVSSDQPELMKALAERAIAEGHGGQNYLAVFELLKKPTPSS